MTGRVATALAWLMSECSQKSVPEHRPDIREMHERGQHLMDILSAQDDWMRDYRRPAYEASVVLGFHPESNMTPLYNLQDELAKAYGRAATVDELVRCYKPDGDAS
jgi:hypothetical protein